MPTTRDARLGALDRQTTAGGLFNAAVIGLFTNNITPGADTKVADLDKCTVAGLTEVTAQTWGPAYQDGDGDFKMAASPGSFVATSLTGLPVQLYGWYSLNTAGTAVAAAKRFDTPINVTQIGDGVTPVCEVAYGD